MNEKAKRILEQIEGNLDYFRELGIEYVPGDSSHSSGELSKEEILSSLDREIKQCQKCPLAKLRKNAVPGEGHLGADLMFVGEGPGRDEDLQGKPFVGRAGELLTKIIQAMKFKRESVYITNVIKCRPPENRNPISSEIEACKGYLFKQIELISPKVIVTLGNVPTRFFLNTNAGITSLRGKFHTYKGIRIMPTFHPSYLVRNEEDRRLRKMVWMDMQKVMAVLGKK